MMQENQSVIYRIHIINNESRNDVWTGLLDGQTEELYSCLLGINTTWSVFGFCEAMDKKYPNGWLMTDLFVRKLDDLRLLPNMVSKRIFVNKNGDRLIFR